MSCGRSTSPASPAAPERTPYSPPAPPTVVTTPEKQAAYMAEHYWDLFDFADTTVWNDREYTLQTFSIYFSGLSGAPEDVAELSTGNMLRLAEADSTAFFNVIELCETILDDPNSPMRNEDLYIHILRRMLASDRLDEYGKMRPAYRLEMSLKNRPGTQAADFAYVDSEGREGRLHTIEAPFTLLFISNPGCEACKTLRDGISASPLLTELIAGGKLKVLSLYPDQDITEWRNHSSEIPAGWIDARDPELAVRDGGLYDLRAIPTLYLLDRDKRVLIKDASEAAPIERAMEAYMRNELE